MFCPTCGTANADNSQFCSKCSAPLQAQAGPAASGTTVAGNPAPMYTGPPESSGKALASLICGIFFFVFPSAIAAIILGHISLSDIRKSAGRLTGHGMAVAGLVLGYLGVAVIPFVLIVAAIAIPNLLRARMVANEASAVGSLRTINTAARTYASMYSNGYPPSLEAMAGPEGASPTCDHAELIGTTLAAGIRSGYVFTYTVRTKDGGQRILFRSDDAAAKGCTIPGDAAYTVTADPITRGTTGQRSWFTDQTGVIRCENYGPATKDSPPLQ
jgi:type IV pilus assembly protein PilA